MEKDKRLEIETASQLKIENTELKGRLTSNTYKQPSSTKNVDVVSAPANESQEASQKQLHKNKNYFLDTPFRSLKDTLAAARAENKLAFIVIYDDAHPRKSKLDYSLGYFLEYNTTKKLVRDYFVPAILDSASEGVKQLVPKDDPLENSLWIVMESDGNIIRCEGVYANPDEGLKRVREVIKISEQN